MPKATTEEKIAKSSGNQTEKYSDVLEKEADDLINQTYHPDKEAEEKKKAEELEVAKKEEEDKKKAEDEEAAKKEDEDTDKAETERKEAERLEVEKKKEEFASIEIQEGETVESIKEKAEGRIKDAQAKMTQATQDAALNKKERDASNTLITTLQKTVETLQSQIQAAPATKEKEKEPDKKTVSLIENIQKEMDVINKLDSEMGAPIKKVVDALVGKVNDLSTQLVEKTKTDEQRIIQTDEAIHYDIIEATHRDWEKIYESQGFNQYIEGLSPRQRNLAKLDLEDGTAENIVELLTDYKEAAGLIKEEKKDEETDEKKEQKNKEKITAAKTLANPTFKKAKEVKTGTPVKYTRTMLKNMSDAEFAEKEKDIDKEMAAGRIANE